MRPGLFISLEGGEGGGKSTQAGKLRAWVTGHGYPVIHTREPGGTSIAEAVRRILLHPRGKIAPMTELLLYEAARAQHLAEVVLPALTQNQVVVCERYTDATEAYQGYGRGLSLPSIRRLNQIATGGLRPDLTILLDVPVGRGLSAARTLSKPLAKGSVSRRGGDRMEQESLGFHRKVRAGYLALARREPKRFLVVSWGGTVDEVHAAITTRVGRLLDRRRKRP